MQTNSSDASITREKLWDRDLRAADVFSIGRRLLASQHEGAGDPQAFRVAVLGNETTDFLAPAIACALYREGVRATLYSGPHGSIVQEILDDSSGLHRFKPEAVLLATDSRDVLTRFPLSVRDGEVGAAQASTIERIEGNWRALEKIGVKFIFQHLPALPRERFRGLAEMSNAGSPQRQITRIREMLLERANGSAHFVDVHALAHRVGIDQWAPSRFFFNGRLPFDPKHLPSYVRLFGASFREATGRAKRVLVVDLDDTLWGGAVGDIGPEFIELGPGSPRGEAFADWQRYLCELRGRGIVLAVCSKNDRATVIEAFRHPHAALRLDDFAVLECSWDDKAHGMRRIASALGLGEETLVFADDNPAECELVKRELPNVGVVTLGPDPSAFIDRLERERWFDASAYAEEDFLRVRSYASRPSAAQPEVTSDLNSYLNALGMTARAFVPEERHLPRIAQLELKTNQFNLTQRRYTESQLRTLRDQENAVLIACEMSDRYARHGLVSSMIGMLEDEAIRIDSWVMSCRVFSRTLEEFLLREFIERARERGARCIIGEYVRSERNAVVAGLYARLGFERADSENRWKRSTVSPLDDLATNVMLTIEGPA